jgi:uridylate kinase
MEEYIVVKLGGSIVSPRGELLNKQLVDEYVKNIRMYYAGPTEKKSRMILVVGGGSICRTYRDFATSSGEDSDKDLHKIGITATWMNAELIRSLLDDLSYENILGVGVYAEGQKEAERLLAKDFEKWLSGDKQVIVAGGFIIGASTDFNAVLLASKIGVDRIFKLTDVDHVYSTDPRENETAEPLTDISWNEFFRLFDVSLENPEHAPGMHIPVDLFAAKLAHENGIGCFLSNGTDPSAITEILNKGTREGTFIHP